jgi:hypothetical protein
VPSKKLAKRETVFSQGLAMTVDDNFKEFYNHGRRG